MHECILYKKLEEDKVNCTACKQKCIIQENSTGLCGIRLNKEGKLYLLVYGKAAASNIDPIEKKPLFHFLPGTEIFSIGTVGCNFGCEFCQNWEISQITRDNKTDPKDIPNLGKDLPPEEIINQCKKRNIPSIAYTYNEPAIFFEYAYDTAKLGKDLKHVFVTNGYDSEEGLNKIHPHLDAMNIDIKSFDDNFYKKICKGQLQPVLDTIKTAHKLGIWLELTTLIIPTQNDSDKEIKQIAEFIAGIDKNIPWHVLAFYPDYKMLDIPPTTKESLLKAYNIGKEAGLNFVYVGNIDDEEHSSTYCPKCKTILIKRRGYSIQSIHFKDGRCTECNEKIPGVWK